MTSTTITLTLTADTADWDAFKADNTREDILESFAARLTEVFGNTAVLTTAELVDLQAETTKLNLREWVPALAQELHGDRWSPNLDMTTHLEAQQQAHKLNISWAADMPADDVAAISDALRTLYEGRNARRRK